MDEEISISPEDIEFFGRAAVAMLTKVVDEGGLTGDQLRELYAFLIEEGIIGFAENENAEEAGEGGGAVETSEQSEAAPGSLGEDDGDVSPPEPLSSPAEPGSKSAPVEVRNGKDVDEAGKRVRPPSEAQAEAGNYRKAHIRVAGLDIAIETPKGGIRMGRDAKGKRWKVRLPVAYGYIKRTNGADDDQLDVFVGPTPENDDVFIIDQMDLETGEFDELKVVLGARSEKQARNIYRRAFSDGKADDRIGGVTRMTMEEFKSWLKDENGSESVAA